LIAFLLFPLLQGQRPISSSIAAQQCLQHLGVIAATQALHLNLQAMSLSWPVALNLEKH
jgi:hypothetical protein